MKTKLLKALTAVILLIIPTLNFAQAPALGTAADFALFTTTGAVGNVGTTYLTHITGNVGSNSAPTFTGFGNVDGVMHNIDGSTSTCAADLLTAYTQLNTTTSNFALASPIGNGDTLIAGVYHIPGASTILNLNLFLDAKGNANAVFIFQIDGTFSTNSNSKIKLINGALACNVFWKVEGLVSMGTGTTMRGTIIVNNAAINISAGDTLEGRALSTAGAISVNNGAIGVLIYLPAGCGSPTLTGPAAPALASTESYAIFSSIGACSRRRHIAYYRLMLEGTMVHLWVTMLYL